MRRDLFGGNDSLDYVDRLMAVTAANAVRGEVHSIQSKDLAGVQSFSGRDHRGVRQIHGMIRVLLHQLKGTRETPAIEEPHRKASPLDELAHSVRADTLRLQHVEGLGEHGDRGTQPFPQRPQGVRRSLMLPIPGIEKRDERPGVHENHLARFFFRRLRTVAPLSVEGPIAYPPGPKSSSR